MPILNTNTMLAELLTRIGDRLPILKAIGEMADELDEQANLLTAEEGSAKCRDAADAFAKLFGTLLAQTLEDIATYDDLSLITITEKE